MQTIIDQALIWYLAALVLVVMLAGAGYAVGTRLVGWAPLRALPAPWRVGAYAVLGVIGLALCAHGFTELAEALDADEELGRFDTRVAADLAASAPVGLVRFFAVLTHLGDPLVLTTIGLIVGVALLWQRRFEILVGWAIALGGSGLLNQALKAIFARARPDHTDGLVQASGYSFPSGHSTGSMVCYGMLAYVVMRGRPAGWHVPAIAVALALAFSVGLSRVMLRVHYVSDVAAGWICGIAWILVCVMSVELALYRRRLRARRAESGGTALQPR